MDNLTPILYKYRVVAMVQFIHYSRFNDIVLNIILSYIEYLSI